MADDLDVDWTDDADRTLRWCRRDQNPPGPRVQRVTENGMDPDTGSQLAANEV